MKKTLIISILSVLILISACTPQRRLERLIKHHPELMRIDTVTVKDTVTVPSMAADTFITIGQEFDTIRVNHDSIQLMIVKRHDTLWFSAKTDTLKITHNIKVPYPVIHNVIEKHYAYIYSAWALIILIIVFLIFRIIKFFKLK